MVVIGFLYSSVDEFAFIFSQIVSVLSQQLQLLRRAIMAAGHMPCCCKLGLIENVQHLPYRRAVHCHLSQTGIILLNLNSVMPTLHKISYIINRNF